MCGSATFTIVVSSTWISVADITASVIIRRSLPVGKSWCGCAAAAGALLISILRRHRHQHAAAHALEQRLLVRLAPPAREAAAMPMSDDDEVGADALRCRGDAVHGVAVLERAFGLDA